jgi:uncharacterized protein (DUF736 family)
MPAIGYVQKQQDGAYTGQLKMASLRCDLQIVPNRRKANDDHPDFIVRAGDIELGAGWIRTGEISRREYVRVSLSTPELPRTIYANLGRAAGQDDEEAFALIWNPAE